MAKSKCCGDIKVDDSFESDLIFFAIKATRSTGKEKLKYLKQLKNLAACEFTYYKKKGV